MRLILPFVVALASTAQIDEAGARPRCLPLAEVSAAVQRHHLQPPRRAIAAAKRHAPGELLAARLCESKSGYVYLLHLLARNGHVARVMIDAKSAEFIGLR